MPAPDPTRCRDCGGPLVEAFGPSDPAPLAPRYSQYDRCRRCGHVFPHVQPTTVEESR